MIPEVDDRDSKDVSEARILLCQSFIRYGRAVLYIFPVKVFGVVSHFLFREVVILLW